ncbi:MAG TPA: hypothetical protein VM934_17330 [Pyrinomonadaceae bacterium]|jgi:tyrosinase|nr:hypothetical protein [Pyrinomonadaceae bacterium]
MPTKAKAAAKKSAKGPAKSGAGAAKSGTVTATGANQTYRASKVYKSAKKINVDDLPAQFSRADLEFIRVDHSEASYEARVFLNNTSADENTPTAPESGYAGSFNIFGHGGCFGNVGHCDTGHKDQDAFDPRPSNPLEPIRKVVIATEAIKKAASQSTEITVTVVPVVTSWTEQCDLTDVLKFDHINLAIYD